jgi:hypothetical protein
VSTFCTRWIPNVDAIAFDIAPQFRQKERRVIGVKRHETKTLECAGEHFRQTKSDVEDLARQAVSSPAAAETKARN